MFAVSAARTMANAKPKLGKDDGVVVRTIQQIRQQKRWERDREKREQARAARAAMDAVIAQYKEVAISPPRPQAREIIREVAEERGFRFDDIVGRSRYKPIVAARHEAIKRVALARPDLSLLVLGRIFDRDHTSILHALRKQGIRP